MKRNAIKLAEWRLVTMLFFLLLLLFLSQVLKKSWLVVNSLSTIRRHLPLPGPFTPSFRRFKELLTRYSGIKIKGK
jgi:hypothetical protein